MFGQNFTQRNRGCCRGVVALVGILNAHADPHGQRKEGQQDREGEPERSPIDEHTGHIEVEGHKHRQEQKHGGDKDYHGRHRIDDSSHTGPCSLRRIASPPKAKHSVKPLVYSQECGSLLGRDPTKRANTLRLDIDCMELGVSPVLLE